MKMTGAQCLADMLAGYGVSHVFMVPAVLRRTFAEMERRTSIHRLHCHGEKAAAYMADGYARASGKPGVCMAQVVGALNLAAGLRDAYLAHSPVIAFTGGRDPKTKFRKVYQEIDDVPAFEPVTKWNATVDAVERFPDMVRQAFRVATSGAPGPVHLQFRGNEGQVDQEEADLEPLVEAQFAKVPPHRPLPDPQSLRSLLGFLQHAERPVIVAGGGARASGAGPELVQLAEALNIPVATSLNGKDCIPGSHPLAVGVVGSYSRESANRVVAAADLVCFVGSSAGGMTTHVWAVPKIGIAALQIDIEPETLGRNYPLKAGVLGDAKTCLSQMLAQCDRSSAARRKGWIEQVRTISGEWRDKYRPALESDAVPVRPERICGELSRGAGRRHRAFGHRPCRHVDGRHVRRARQSELHAQRRASGLGVPGRPRREVRRAGAAGGNFYRRRRPLVPPRRDRDRGALEHRRGDGGEQQCERQPVQARLRPRLRRRADREGARAVDLSHGGLREGRRRHRRPRHPRGKGK